MVKSSLRELLYGHAGRAIYNEQYDDWSLGRDGKTFHQLPQLGKTKRLLKGTGDLAAEETVLDTARDEEDRYDRSLKRCIELLIRGYPELAPAHRLLGVEHRVSERIAKGVAKYDPAKGNLIAYGSVSNMHEDDDGHVSFVPLLALPGGRCGEALRLVRLEEQTHGWEKEYEGRELEPLSPSREVGWWVGKGAPILHIVFAESLDDTGSDFLAVRLQGVTIILEPCYERRMIPPSGASLDRPYPPSRVHAKPVFEITPESSLSGVHADVSFNPWDHEQFATVDDQGYWAIFGVDKVHKKGKLRQHELQGHGHSGKFDWEEGLEDEDIILEPDGWGRIFWAGSETTLVVCIRQQIVILDMETKTVTPVKLPELYGMRPGIHLDCLRCPGKPQWFFLLTTKQLIWFEVLDLDLNDAAVGRRKEKTKILHSTRHFRNPLDISLHLKVLVEDDNILVLLASRFNEAVTCFRFNTSSDRFLLPGWASDPTPLTLPVPKKARSSLLDFSIVPVQAVGADAEEIISEEEETSSDDEEEEIWELPSQAVEHEDLDDDDEDMVDERAVPDPPRFYGLQILKRDFSLNHVMLQSKPDKDSKVHSNPPTPLLQSIETHSATGRVGSLRRSWEPRDEMDDFIVEDDIELERAKYWDPISEEIPRFKVTYKKKNPQTKKQLFENRKRGPTLNKERVMHKMCQSLRQGDTTLLWEDLEAITSDLEGLVLAREEGLGLPSVTLQEQIQSIPKVSDITKADGLFSDLFETTIASEFAVDPSLAVHRLPIPVWANSLGISIEDITFSEVYNHLIDRNLVDLDREIPNRTRVAKERAARSAAADFILASAAIRLVDIEPSNTQELLSSSQVQGIPAGVELTQETLSSQIVTPSLDSTAGQPFTANWQPPAPRKSQREAIEQAAIQLPIAGNLPTPTPSISQPSRTPSLATSISHTSFSRGHHKRHMNAVKNRLSHYAEIHSPRKGRNARPAALLTHWSLGEDPADYKYREVSQVIESAREEALMTEAERRELYKGRRRFERERVREEEKYRKWVEMQGSQMTVLVSSPPRGGGRGESKGRGNKGGKGVEKGKKGGKGKEKKGKKRKRVEGF